jgi:Zn-dependent hydrolases, including glyoxylases
MIEKIKLKVTNCFVVKIDNKTILVDTGYDFEFENLISKLREKNITVQDIDYLFITHCHDDHVGSVTKIINQKPQIQLILSKKAIEFALTGRHNNIKGSGYINKRIAFILRNKGMINKKWTHSFPSFEKRNTDIVIDRDICLRDIGFQNDGKIILTPGHTLDHISLIIDDVCLSGDAVANFPTFIGLNYCVVSVNDLTEYYKSWQKIIANNINTILPSHGDNIDISKIKRAIYKNKEKNMVKWSTAITNL